MKKKVKINDIKQVIKEEVMKEIGSFEKDFGNLMNDMEEYNGEDAVEFGDTISDKEYKDFDEKMEDVYTDINNIFSNISDIESNIDYYYPNDSVTKQEIFKLLQEIKEKTDSVSYKIGNLIND